MAFAVRQVALMCRAALAPTQSAREGAQRCDSSLKTLTAAFASCGARGRCSDAVQAAVVEGLETVLRTAVQVLSRWVFLGSTRKPAPEQVLGGLPAACSAMLPAAPRVLFRHPAFGVVVAHRSGPCAGAFAGLVTVSLGALGTPAEADFLDIASALFCGVPEVAASASAVVAYPANVAAVRAVTMHGPAHPALLQAVCAGLAARGSPAVGSALVKDLVSSRFSGCATDAALRSLRMGSVTAEAYAQGLVRALADSRVADVMLSWFRTDGTLPPAAVHALLRAHLFSHAGTAAASPTVKPAHTATLLSIMAIVARSDDMLAALELMAWMASKSGHAFVNACRSKLLEQPLVVLPGLAALLRAADPLLAVGALCRNMMSSNLLCSVATLLGQQPSRGTAVVEAVNLFLAALLRAAADECWELGCGRQATALARVLEACKLHHGTKGRAIVKLVERFLAARPAVAAPSPPTCSSLAEDQAALDERAGWMAAAPLDERAGKRARVDLSSHCCPL